MPLTAEVPVGNGAQNDGFGGDDAGTFTTPVVLGSIASGAAFGIFDGFGHNGVVGEDLLLHPGNTAETAYVIVRYTISADDIANGTFATITGSFRDLQGNNNANSGNSIQAQVLQNGTSLFTATGEASRLFADGQLPSGVFAVGGTVAEGDTISFVVFNNSLFFGDETALQASIDLSPPPADQSPLVLTDPVGQDLFIGDTLNLSVSAAGAEPLSYQWRQDGVNIEGATEPTFTINSVVAEDAGSYDNVVSNEFGSTTSAAAEVVLSVLSPEVVTQPISQTLAVGQTLTLSVTAEGSAPLTFQWFRNFDEEIPGATDSTFVIEAVTEDDSAQYDVQVSNSAGTDFSVAADVVVRTNEAPVASSQNGTTTENVPLSLSPSVVATDADDDPLFFVGADLTSALGASILFSDNEVVYIPVSNSTAIADTFSAVVSDGFVTATVAVTVDVVSATSVVIANPGADYVDASTLPSGWSYLSADAASGGFETPLEPVVVLGNGGNTGFGLAANQFNVPAVLGSLDGGDEFEIFDDGFEGRTPGTSAAGLATGNRGLEGVDLLLHPGNDIDGAFTIARYTVSADDLANGSNAIIEGSFRELTGGTGATSVTAQVFLNGSELFSTIGTGGRLLQADGSFNVTPATALSVGDTISFTLGNNGDFFGDETALRAVISLTGEAVQQATPVTLNTPQLIGDNVVFTFTRVAELPGNETQIFEFSEDLVFTAENQIPIDAAQPEVTFGTPANGLQEVTVTIGIGTLTNSERLFGRVSSFIN